MEFLICCGVGHVPILMIDIGAAGTIGVITIAVTDIEIVTETETETGRETETGNGIGIGRERR